MGEKILVIEDDPGIRKVISDFLVDDGKEVVHAKDGQEGMDMFDQSINLVILDIMMPKLDGWSVCRRIRKNSDVPIIMLTARTDEDDELMGFELKASDYVKKPFSPAVLVARVNKLLNTQIISDTNTGDTITHASLMIENQSRMASIDGRQLDLTMKCYDILWLFVNNEGIVFSRDQILDKIWGYDYFGDSRVVDNHIKKIRKALEEKSYYIRTVFGVGYKFEVNHEK